MAKEIPANIVSNRMAYLDANAKPLACGRLAIYLDGSSTSLALVYGDAALDQLLENPVMLDSSGRAPALYAEGSVYARVEKYVGKDSNGDNIYELVYDFETPPGVDISTYWNVNYVETYDKLRETANQHPTWVTKEGNPHLYVWNPDETDIDEVINVSSRAYNKGAWHWETKVVYADQCSIPNDGTILPGGNSYLRARWQVFANVSRGGIKAVIPQGTYNFDGLNMLQTYFNELEISSNVVFENIKNRWGIGIYDNVECLSKNLPIRWVYLPQNKFYDSRYFSDIVTIARHNVILESDAEGYARNLKFSGAIEENLEVLGFLYANKYVSAKRNIIAHEGDIIAYKGTVITPHLEVGESPAMGGAPDYGPNGLGISPVNLSGNPPLYWDTITKEDNPEEALESFPVGSYLTAIYPCRDRQAEKEDFWDVCHNTMLYLSSHGNPLYAFNYVITLDEHSKWRYPGKFRSCGVSGVGFGLYGYSSIPLNRATLMVLLRRVE